MDPAFILLIAVPVLLIIILLAWWISVSNNFHRKQIKIKEALSGIEIALTNRFDKLTKLLDVAKGFAAHEKETFSQVISLRKGMNIGELNQANAQCDQLMARINAVAEGYPELRSAEMFRELQGGIREAEAHLQAARRLYNSNVTLFNTAVVIFPSNIVANAKHLQKAEFFEAEEAKKADVKISF
ncbi:MAG: LemA family protein [Oscillospiraceae bacterium]|jgi:LemA protein|nr:LemA family protein [Oscillospiraceae bacterium]